MTSSTTIPILGFGSARPAQAQGSSPGRQTTAKDTSWFAQYHTAPRDTLLPSAYEGWKQFQLNCSRCHGQDARGTSFAPSLVHALAKGGPVATEEAFLKIACNGVPGTGMPAWCKLGLGTDQLRDIYLYLSGRANGAIQAGRPAERENRSVQALR